MSQRRYPHYYDQRISSSQRLSSCCLVIIRTLNVVGADIVEIAPAYDGVGQQTALVAAQIEFEILTSWVGRGMKMMKEPL